MTSGDGIRKGLPCIRRFDKRYEDKRADGIRMVEKKVRQMLTGEGWQEGREGS